MLLAKVLACQLGYFVHDFHRITSPTSDLQDACLRSTHSSNSSCSVSHMVKLKSLVSFV